MLSRIICTDSLLQFRARISAKLSQLIGFASCPEITLEMFNSPDEGTGSSLLRHFAGEDSVLLNDPDSTADSGLVLEIPFFFLSSCIIGFDSCCSCEPNINKRKHMGICLIHYCKIKLSSLGAYLMKLFSDIISCNDIQLVSCTQGAQLEKVKFMKPHRSDRINPCRREIVMSEAVVLPETLQDLHKFISRWGALSLTQDWNSPECSQNTHCPSLAGDGKINHGYTLAMRNNVSWEEASLRGKKMKLREVSVPHQFLFCYQFNDSYLNLIFKTQNSIFASQKK